MKKISIIFIISVVIVSSFSPQMALQGATQEMVYCSPATAIAVSDNLAYVATETAELRVLNITEPNEITEIWDYYEEVGNFKELVIKEDLLYTTAGKNGLIIFDISDVSESFEPMCHINGIANTTGFIAVENNLAILDINGEGFAIIDVSNPTNPNVLSQVDVYTDVYDIFIDNDLVYVVGFTTGVIIYDISDPENPSEIANYNPSEIADYTDDPGIGFLATQDIDIVGDLAYITLGNYGLGIFNITDPQNMTLVEYYDETVVGRLYDVQIVNNYGYFVSLNYTSNELGIQIYDISNTSNLVSISNYFTTTYKTEDIFIDTANNLIFLAQLKGGILILDASDIYNLQLLGSIDFCITITSRTKNTYLSVFSLLGCIVIIRISKRTLNICRGVSK